jgi:hypothetical protein
MWVHHGSFDPARPAERVSIIPNALPSTSSVATLELESQHSMGIPWLSLVRGEAPYHCSESLTSGLHALMRQLLTIVTAIHITAGWLTAVSSP